MKQVLDIQAGDAPGIDSTSLGNLVASLDPSEMFWFAGDGGVLSRTPTNSPLAVSASSIKSVVGAVNLGDAVTGRITAATFNPDQALKLSESIKGLIALGQLAGNQQADFKSLLGGLTVTQEAAQVTLALNFPADLLAKIGQSRGLRVR